MVQRIVKLFSAASVVLVATLASTAMAAGVPNMYIAQTKITAPAGSDVTLPVRINAAGVQLDTVQIVATFPADKLTFVGLDTAGSPFTAVVPATPVADGGKVTFGAAELSASPITGDKLVASLVFKANASSGTAAVSLSGSEALRDGKAVAGFTTGGTMLAFTGSGASSTAVGIGAVAASGVTVNSATIHWHTAVPSSSVVDFGQTPYYGMSVGSDSLVTNHTVALGAVLAGATKTHFRVTSVAANGQYQTSGDQVFTTQGYTVAITVTNTAGKPISGAKVQVANLPAITTDGNGVVVVPDVSSGVQKVTIGKSTQNILVKSAVGKLAAKVQPFTLVSEQSSVFARLLLGGLIIIVLLGVALLTLRLMAKRHGPKGTGTI